MIGSWRYVVPPSRWRLGSLYQGLFDPVLLADIAALEALPGFERAGWQGLEAACARARRVRGFLDLRDRWLDGPALRAHDGALRDRLEPALAELDRAAEQLCAADPGHAFSLRVRRSYGQGQLARLEALRRRLEAVQAASPAATEDRGLDLASFDGLVRASLDVSDDTLGAIRHVSEQRLPRLVDQVRGLERRGGTRFGWRKGLGAALNGVGQIAPEARTACWRAVTSGQVRAAGPDQGGYTLSLGPGQVFVCVPWQGTRESARTLAHEFGHLAHSALAAHQGPLLAQTGLALAEAVAFVVEEVSGFPRGAGARVQALAPFVEEDERVRSALRDDPSRRDRPDAEGLAAGVGRGVFALSYPLGLALALHVLDRRQFTRFCDVLRAGGTLSYEQALAHLNAPSPLTLFGAMYDRIEQQIAAERGGKTDQGGTHARRRE